MVVAWHVDYWNRLGQGHAMGAWVDPFSSAAASQRQSAYARAWAERGRWTPQWRVEGKSLRGRQLGQLLQSSIKEGAAKPPVMELSLSGTWTEPKSKSDKHALVRAHVGLKLLKTDLELPDSVRVLPLLIQRKAVTAVPRGENKGKTLTEFYVVRAIGKPVTVKQATAEKGASVELKAPRSEKAKNLGVAVIVEDTAKMRPLESRFVSLKVVKRKKVDHSEGEQDF